MAEVMCQLCRYSSDSQLSALGDPKKISRRTATSLIEIQKISNTHLNHLNVLCDLYIIQYSTYVTNFYRAQFLTETRVNIVDVQWIFLDGYLFLWMCIDIFSCLTTNGNSNENGWRPQVGSRPTAWEPLQSTPSLENRLSHNTFCYRR